MGGSEGFAGVLERVTAQEGKARWIVGNSSRTAQRLVRLGSRNVLSDFKLQITWPTASAELQSIPLGVQPNRAGACTVMTTFTYWKGVADVATGVVLLTKPEIIYHSAVAKFLNQISGLRLPNAHPTAEGEVSSQHAVTIMVRIRNSCAL